MSRRFALLFWSTFIAVSLVHVPTLAQFLSASWSALIQPSSAIATVSPLPPVVLPSLPASPGFSPSPAAPADRALPVSVRYDFYPIGGATANELRSQMSAKSPVSNAQGYSFDALTSWSVHWNFRFARNGKNCSARAISSRVDVVFTLPQWRVPNFVSSSLQSEWSDYIEALKLHEEGHKKNGMDAAQAVQQALSQLPSYSTCQKLQKVAQQTADQIIAVYNQRDIDYDRITGHGRTQGAVFPTLNARARAAKLHF